MAVAGILMYLWMRTQICSPKLVFGKNQNWFGYILDTMFPYAYLEFVRSVPGPPVSNQMEPNSPVLSAGFSTPTRPITRSVSRASRQTIEERESLSDLLPIPGRDFDIGCRS